MKKVEFVRVSTKSCGFGPIKGMYYKFPNIEPIIKEKIEAGWDFCGYVPITTRGSGDIETISLIFQKEE